MPNYMVFTDPDLDDDGVMEVNYEVTGIAEEHDGYYIEVDITDMEGNEINDEYIKEQVVEEAIKEYERDSRKRSYSEEY